MKTVKTFKNIVLIIGLAVAAMACLPSSVQAQVKGAELLKKVQTAEDVQTIEAGDTIVMTCPKCKTTYTQVVEKSFHATPDELKNTTTHLCSSCDTRLVTRGMGKQAKNELVHTCKMCGSEDVTCCLMKKGSGPTSGMEEKK